MNRYRADHGYNPPNCTCGGTVVGFPQHEADCGLDLDKLMERAINRGEWTENYPNPKEH